jgi:hypothetical protein
MKICIDIDDYHTFPPWECTDVLGEILSRYPEAKFTLFFTPRMKGIPFNEKPHAVDKVRDLMRRGNVEVLAHGLTHKRFVNGEFGSLPEFLAGARIDRAFALFREAEIECGKGFKFPWNMSSRGSLRALEKRGYVLFSNKHEEGYGGRQVAWMNYGKLRKRWVQTAEYRYGQPTLPQQTEIIYYHAHAQNVRSNGIRESCKNLLRELGELERLADLEFIFCSDRSIFSESAKS